MKKIPPNSISRLNLLILINWHLEGEWYFLRHLKQRVEKVDILQPLRWPVFRNRRLDRLNIYLSEFYLPILAFLKRKRFHAIVSWQMRLGVCYGLLNRLNRDPFAAAHIIQDFHIDPERKNWAYKLRLKMLSFSIRGIDYFLCTSTPEKTLYIRRFNIFFSRLIFLPLSPPYQFLRRFDYPKGDYLFAYGNSDRDYETLIGAVKNLSVPVIILSRTFFPKVPLPKHIKHIHQPIPEKDLIRYLAGARAVVLPITHPTVAAGQFAMLETMAVGRPLIVSANVATLEYACHGETALFFNSRDVSALQRLIIFVLQHPKKAEEIGQRAKAAVAHLPDQQVEVFCKLLQNIIK
jgi:glycosyltransferase involved in cell wall biosynthesis